MSNTLKRNEEDGRREMEGMVALDQREGRPWLELLAGPHPAHVARAAGALCTLTQRPEHAYMIAYRLDEIGMLRRDEGD